MKPFILSKFLRIRSFIHVLLIVFLIGCSAVWNAATANTISISAAVNWSAITGGTGPGTLPSASDSVVILNANAVITVNVNNAVCKFISIEGSSSGNNNSGGLTFNSGSDLTVSGDVIIGQSGGNKTSTLVMTSGGTLHLTGAFTIQSHGAFTVGAGTIDYNSSGAQAVTATTYNNLTISNAGAKTFASGTTINGILSIQGTATTAGTTPTYGSSSTLQYNGSSQQTTSTVELPATGVPNLQIDNANGVILNAATSTGTSGTVTLTNGILTTTSSKLLSVTNTATTAVSAGSTSTFIDGPVKWSLSNTAGTYMFSVGNGSGNYLPFKLVTTAASSPVITVQAFNADAGSGATFGTSIAYLSHTEYWSATLVSGTFTGKVSLTRQTALSGLDIIGQSTLQGGSYSSIAGTASSPSINTSNSITTLGFFAMASNQNYPTSVSIGSQTGTVTYGTTGSSTYTVTITTNSISGASNGSATLSLTGTSLATGVTAAFSPNPVTLTAGTTSFTSTLTLTTTGASTPAGTTSGITANAANTPGTSLFPTSVTTGSASFVVNTAGLTITATGPAMTYGTALSTISGSTTNFTTSGLKNSDAVTSVTLTPDANGTSTTRAAGLSYGVTPSAAAGSGLSNYTITYTALAGTIGQKSTTASLTGTVSKTYDGSTTATLTTSNYSLSGIINSDAVTITTTSGTYDTKNQGTGKTVSVTGLTLGGTNAGNYILSSTSASGAVGTINTLALSIGAPTISSKTYDGTTTAGAVTTGTLSGFAGSETVTATATAAAYSSANAGSYSGDVVTYTLHDGTNGGLATNYSLAAGAATGTVTAKALSIGAPTIASKAYDGTTTAGAVTTGTLSGFVGSETVTAIGAAAAYSSANVGSYSGDVITYTLYDGTNGGLAINYSLVNGTATGSVTALALSITAPTIASKAYDGTTTAGAVTTGILSGFIGSETVTATGTAASYSSPNVGSYSSDVVTYTLHDGTNGGLALNYSLAAGTATGSVTPLALSITSPTIASKVYDGTATAGAVTVGTLSGFVGSQTVTASGAAADYSSASVGSYPGDVVTYTLSNGTNGGLASNYSLANGTATGNISAAGLTITGLTGNNKVYDQTTDATFSGTAALSGVITADLSNVTLGGTPSASFVSAAVANGITINVSGYTISGPASGNYSLTQPTLTGNITQLALTTTGATASNKAYDGTTTDTITGESLVGIISPDNVTVSGGGTFASDAVGNGIAVTASLTLGGADAGNYSLTQPTGLTADITGIAVTITGVTANKVYDGTTVATLDTTSAALSGVPPADAANVSLVSVGATGTFADPNVANGINVTTSGFILTGSSAAYYTLVQPTLSANITAAPLTVTGLTGNNKVYDQTTAATFSGTAALSGVIAADTSNVTLGGTPSASFVSATVANGITINVSGYTISGSASTNYSLTQPTLTGNITQLALSTTGATANDKMYDGTTAATITGESLVGVISPDVVTVSGGGSFAASSVGSGVAVTAALTLGGADGGNYSLTQPTGLTANINAKALSVTAPTIASKAYDGTTAAGAVTVGTLSGFVGSETVTATGAAAAYSSANAGSYPGDVITYTLSDGTNGGVASNYSLANGTATGIVTAVSLSITAPTIASKFYDGTTTAGAVTIGTLSGFVGSETVTASGVANAYSSANVGSYPGDVVTYTLSDGTNGGLAANYSLANGTATGTVNALSLSITAPTIASKAYDGTTTAGTVNVGTLSGFAGSETVTVTATAASYSSANVGSYPGDVVTYALHNGTNGGVASNYSLSNGTATGTITGLALSITAPTIASKVYDGTNTAGAVTVGTLSGFVGSQTVTATATAAAYSSANVGSYPGDIITYTLSDGTNGGLAANYTLATGTATGTVTAKALSVTAPTIASKVYDGTTTAGAVTVGTLSGFVGSETVTSTATAAAYSSANVGAYSGDVVTYTLSDGTNGGLAANYSLANGTATGTVTALALSVTAPTIASKAYDGTTTAGAVTVGTLSGFVGSQTVTATGSAAAYSSASVGSYPGDVITYTLSNGTNGGLASNYSLANGTATGVIAGKVLSITAPTIASKIYDGTTTAGAVTTGTLSGFSGSETVTATATAAAYSSANVGSYPGDVVTYTLHDGTNGGLASNYSLATGTATGVVTAKALTVSGITASNKIYDATTIAPLGGTAALQTAEAVGTGTTVDGIPYIGDAVTIGGTPAGTFASKNVANGIAITVTGNTLSGAQAGNYTVTQQTGLSANITVKTLTVTGITASNKVYDGTTTVTLGGAAALQTAEAAGGGTTADGKPYTGDAVTIGGTAVGTFTSKDAANGIAITITGNSISGAQSTNYSISQQAGLTANITPKALTVSGITASNKVYDGTTTATLGGTAALQSSETAGTGTTADGKPYSGDVVTIGGTASGTFASKNVANGIAVTITGNTLSGAQGGNYTITQQTGLTANITALAVQLSGTRAYDGTAIASSSNLTISNNQDGANLTLSGSGLLASKNVGSQAISVPPTPARVNSATGNGGANAVTTFNVTVSAPTIGNTMVAVVAMRSNTTVSSITQSGVTWTLAAQATGVILQTEIWYAPVSSAAGTTVTINHGSTRSAAVVIEYSGILTASPLDVTATNTGTSTTPSTGTTAATGQANELLIGGIGLANSTFALTSITNSFDTVATSASTNGTAGNNAKVFALEKFTSVTGTVTTGGTTTNVTWSGAVATFNATLPSGSPFALSGSAAGNYTLSGMTGSMVITAKALTTSGATASNKQYDRTTAATITGESLVGVISPDVVTVSGGGTFASANVGTGIPITAALTLGGADAGNYSITQPTGLTANITGVTLTITGVTANNKTYDKTTSAALNTGSAALSGVLAGDVGNVTLNSGSATGTFASANVANGITVTTSGFTISGSASGNYSLTQPTLTANITAKALTVSGITASNKIYNGNTTATLGGTAALQTAEAAGTGTTGDGIPYTGDVVTIGGTPAGTFASKDVANGIAITVTGNTLSGAQAGNYSITQQTGLSANITPKAVTALGTLVFPASKIYDGTTTATATSGSAALQGTEAAGAGTTADGKPYSVDAISLTGTASYAYNSKDVATASTITESGLSLTGTGNGNYTLTAPNFSSTITGKALTAVGSLVFPASKVYDGTTTATPTSGSAALQSTEATGAGTTADGIPYSVDAVSLTGTAAYNYNSLSVASATTITESGLSLTGTGNGNYTLTAPVFSATITKKALTAVGSLVFPASKVYDGTTTATPTSGSAGLQSTEAAGAGSTGDGKPYSVDAVSLTGTAAYNYNSLSVASASTITESGLSLTGTGNANYTLTAPTFGSIITAKALTALGTLVFPATKVYDGTTTATATSGSAALLGTEAAGAGTTADGKPYSVDAVSLTGTAAYNYNSKDVATATTITESGLSLTGTGNGNYTLTAPSFSSKTITAKALTALGTLVFPASKVYDGTTTATPTSGSAALLGTESAGAGTTADGKPYSVDAVSLTGTAAYNYNSKDVATASTITESGLSLTGTGNGNYSLTAPSFTSKTITAKALIAIGTLVFPSSKVYDGTTTATPTSGSAALQSTEAAGAGTTADGTPYSVDAVSLTGTAAYNYNSKNVTTASTITESGLSLTGTGNGNYTLTAPVFSATITPLGLSITAPTIASKAYDGTTTAGAVTTGTLSGFVGSETVTAAGTAAAYSSANVGSYPGDVVTYTLSNGTNGGLATNYSLANGTATGVITGKVLSVTAPTIASKAYDGTTTAGAVTVGTLSGFTGSETVTATATAAAYSSANVGSYPGDVITYTLHDGTNGGLAANYSLANGTATGTVTALALSITAPTIASKTYDGTTTAGAVTVGTLSGFVGSETVTASGAAAAYSSRNVGSYPGDVVTYTLSNGTNGGLASNYSLANGTATGTVTAKALTALGTLSISSKIYDGTTAATPTGSAALLGTEAAGAGTTVDGKPYSVDAVSLTGTAAYAYNTKDVATATTVTESGLSLTGSGNANYTLTAPSLSATITAKALTAAGTLVFPASKVYDGTTTATPTSGSAALLGTESAGAGTTADGKPYSVDAVSLTGTAAYNYNSKDVATASTITESGLSLTGTGNGNYSLTAPSFTSKTITAKALIAIGTLVFPSSKVYDGTTTATPTSGSAALQSTEAAGAGTTADGTPYSVDAVSLTGTAAYNYNSKNVTTASTITESGLSLTGTGNGNYTLTVPTFSSTITVRSLTLTANNVNKAYGVAISSPGSGQTTFTPSGLQNGETVGTVTITYGTGAAASAAVGTYNTVAPSAATGGTFTASNYSVSYANGNIIVGQVPLTITANIEIKCFGQNFTVNGTTQFTATGLLNSDAVSSVTLASAGYTSSATVAGSPYSIIPSAATGTGLGNYTITYVNNTMTVYPLPSVTVAPSPATICLGTSSTLTALSSGGTVNQTFSGASGTINLSVPVGVDTAYNYSTISLATSDSLHLASTDIISVSLSLTLTTQKDVDVFLVAPGSSGAMVLFKSTGSNSNNINTTIVTDSTAVMGSPIGTGPYAPQGSITTAPDLCCAIGGTFSGLIPAGSLNGVPIDGAWSLRAFESNSSIPITLVSWSLSITKTSNYTTAISGPATIGSIAYTGVANDTAKASVTPPVGSNTYTVTTTDGLGCTSTSTTTSVTVDSIPVNITPTGATTICAGNSVNISIAGSEVGTNYQLRNNSGNTNIGSAVAGTGGTINLPTGNLSTTTTLNVLATKASTTCSVQMPGTVTVTVHPLPTATISGTTAVCFNASSPNITFTGANATAPYTFTYTLNGGSNLTVSTTSGNSVTVSAPTSSTGTFTYALVSVQESSSTACSQAQSGSATVTVNPLPTASIGGTTAVCKNATAPNITFTGANGTAPYTFTYKINSGSNLTVSTTSGNSVNVAASTSTAGTFVYSLVSVHDASSTACSQTQSGSATITVNPLPTASISGTTAVCVNATSPNVTFTGASGTAPYTFTYKINTGSNQTVTTTSGNSVTVAAPTGSSGSFVYSLVSVQDASSTACTQTQSGSATITVNPLPTASISGTTAVCQGSSSPNVTFTGAAGTAPYTFIYNINSGANDTVTTASGNSVTVAASTSSTGSFVYSLVSVQDASSTTCSQTQSGSATITVNPVPTASISGTTTVCQNSSAPNVTLTGANGTAPYTFIYTINSGANDTVTTTSGNSVAVAASTSSSGSFVYSLVSVQDASASTCSQTPSGSATITVDTVSVGGASVVATSPICEDSSTTIMLAGYSGAIQWQQSADGTSWANVTGGSGATSPTYTTAGLSSETYYQAVVTSGVCASANSTPDSVIINLNAHISLSSGSSSQTICANNAITNVVYTISGAGTGASASGLPTGVTGVYSAGIFTISGTPTTPGTYYYTVSTSGSACSNNTADGAIQVNDCGTTVSAKFFIQGYYLGAGKMSPLLTLIGASGNTNDVDSVIMELHSTSNLDTAAYTSFGILKNDGTLLCPFGLEIIGNYYYIVIKHRNSIETWSADSVLMSTTNSYDFTTSASQAYGNNMINLGDGNYGIFNGDVTQDGSVDASDYSAVQGVISSFIIGQYDIHDINGDGMVDQSDYRLIRNYVPLNATLQRPH